ncbi:MAG: amidohydrolase family protein, partial [Candidatus Cloacimonadaceae bacterium]|nr:amidohydrolase family protein [Candidatus Cloacimonadaceae bacterium]
VDIDDYPYHSEAAQDLWARGVVGLVLMNPSINPAISDISYTEIMDLFLDIYDSDTSFAYQGFDLQEAKHYNAISQASAIKKLLRRMQENPIHFPRVTHYDNIEFINGISKRSDISFSLNINDLMHILCGVKRDGTLELNLTERLPELLELFRMNKIYILSNNAIMEPLPEDVSEVYGGSDISTMQYSYLWILSELWKKRKYTLHSCIKMSSENPAKRLGIYPQKGCLDAGSDADFVIYDPSAVTITPYETADSGPLQLSGAIKSVYIKGMEVYDGKDFKRNGGWLFRTHSPKRRHNNTTWI